MLFSVIVPVRKCPLPLLGSTLEGILNQKDVQFEVIVVDASNCPQTQDFIHRYENLQVHDTEQRALDAIIQCGVDAAQGDYVNILLPGEFYVSQYALQTVQEFIEQSDMPDIIQCGWMQQGKACFESRIPWLLKKGFYPITLQNYWFKNKIFEKVGSFDTTFQFRGKFDLFCRLNQSGVKWVSFKRVLTDSDRWLEEPSSPVIESKEMLTIISKHFGIITALSWWCTQNQINFFKSVFRSLRKAFFARG